jgi:hypothetical protein
MKLAITIPTDLSEIKLSQYQKFLNIVEQNEESDFLHHKMIEIFCNVELKYVSQFKHKQIIQIVTTINNLFDKIPPFKNKFTLNGIDYGFIPNLDDISQGEYMDLDNYIVDVANLHRSMAVMFRPIKTKLKDKYIIEPYEGSDMYAEKMLDAPLDVVLASRVFFYHLGRELLKSTLIYLEGNPQIQSILTQHNSENDGAGTHPFMHLLKEMSGDLMKSPNFRLINV